MKNSAHQRQNIFKSLICCTALLFFLSANSYSEDNSDSTKMDYRKDMKLSIFASADQINPNGYNSTFGIISSVEIYHNKIIPISAFFEMNYSIPLVKDSSQSFSCINAGFRFTRRITDTWSFGLDFGSGIALYDEQLSVNSTVRTYFTYRSLSLFLTMRGIVSDKSNASCNGIGFSYSF